MSKKGSTNLQAHLLDGDFSLTDRRVSHHAMARARQRGVPTWKLGARGALGDGEAVLSSNGLTVVTVVPDKFKRAAAGAQAARRRTREKNNEGRLTRRHWREAVRLRLRKKRGIKFIAELAIPVELCGAWIGPRGKFIKALQQKAKGMDVVLAQDDLGEGKKSDGVLFLAAKVRGQIETFVADGLDDLDLPRQVSFEGLGPVRHIVTYP